MGSCVQACGPQVDRLLWRSHTTCGKYRVMGSAWPHYRPELLLPGARAGALAISKRSWAPEVTNRS